LNRLSPCRDCGGILKSATISFGQPLAPAVIERALRAAGDADLFFAIGTSLQVYPIAGAVEVASDSGAKIVIVNAEPTLFDAVLDAVLQEPIGDILPRLLMPGSKLARFAPYRQSESAKKSAPWTPKNSLTLLKD
jgi:NAD-dependent deacetylase